MSKSDIQQYLLVLRCQAGDEDAFEQLYNLYRERTLRYLKGLSNQEIARDINQEVWLSVFQNISQLMNPKSFRSWLFRIARFEAIDQLRAKQRRIDLKEKAAGEIFDDSVMPNLEEFFKQYNVDLQAIIDELPAHKREVIILRYWEGMSYEEIALIVGCPIGTVRSRIYHAKQKIKELMNERDHNF